MTKRLKVYIAVGGVLLLLAGFFWFNPFATRPGREAAITLRIESSGGVRGTHENRVNVTLDNPGVEIRGIQLEVCDSGNYLACSGCDLAGRAEGFTCVSHEKKNGCYEVILFSFGDLIREGSGRIFSYSCTISDRAPAGECLALEHRGIQMADAKREMLKPEVLNGTFCFDDCRTAANCDPGLWCYTGRACVNGSCQSLERCPDDGRYCNGVEYCDEERDRCSTTPEPCAYCYALGCSCNEEKDGCTQPTTDDSERTSI